MFSFLFSFFFNVFINRQQQATSLTFLKRTVEMDESLKSGTRTAHSDVSKKIKYSDIINLMITLDTDW